LLDFTVDGRGLYKKNEVEKINQRIINEAQTATSALIHDLGFKDSIRSAKTIESNIAGGLRSSQALTLLGIEIITVNILAVRATPEMARALETETREKLSQEADQAIYARRICARWASRN
jgi:regulator of protease activity HflC (stomatin/prohibitin superfamily)